MLKQTNKTEPKIVFVHNSLMGGSARIARMFGYPTTHIDNYYDDPQYKIVLLVRQPYLTESVSYEKAFLDKYYHRIVGCIVADDKTNGPYFGVKANAIKAIGIPVIAVLDRILTLETKNEIERWLKQNVK